MSRTLPQPSIAGPPRHPDGILRPRSFAARTVAIAVVIALAIGSYGALNTILQNRLAQETPRQARFFASAIDEALARLDHLPFVISIDPRTLRALQTRDVAQMNAILSTIAERARAEFVYLMDTDGLTIASSNFADPDSLVGRHYTFRPYFRDAMAGETGRFHAVGVTTGRPGYFISAPVRARDGTIAGVVVVKIGFADLARALTGSGAVVFVTDRHGVVLTGSDPDLIFGLLAPLGEADRQVLQEQQQFGDRVLTPLDWQAGDGRATLKGVTYMWTQANIAGEDWTLHLLSDLGDLRRRALLYVGAALMALLTLAIAATVLRSARLRRALTAANTDRQRLVAEIDERCTAEARLAEAREELARAGRLAALGQLSVSITHELGQPISAMRNYLAAEEITGDARPGSLLPEITGLVERMQRIVDQLRLFGRREPATEARFVVQKAVGAAVALVRHTAEQAGVALTVRIPDAPCRTAGPSARFEQVIVNLLRNAIDAVEPAPRGAVDLTVMSDGASVTITVADNGPGLGALRMDDLREPFFSTKPSGQGMGLGLAISAQIIAEMGGEIGAENATNGGAVFTVTLAEDTTDG